MDKSIFIYSVFCLVIIHLNVAVSQDFLSLPQLPSLRKTGDFEKQQESLPTLSTEEKLISSNDVADKDLPELQSTLDSDKSDVSVNVNKSIPNNSNDDSELKLPSLFNNLDSKVEINSDKSVASLVDKDADNKAVVNAQSDHKSVPKSYNTPEDETTVSSIIEVNKRTHSDDTDKTDKLDKEDNDNEEDYSENEDDQEEKKTTTPADQDNDDDDDDDDDDEEYEISKWKQDDEDDDNDTEWNDENDKDVDDDFEPKTLANEIVDGLAKKSKPPTAPTSMVLFYTWMIVVVLIIIVGVSTYQSRCKGFRFSRIKTASTTKDDKKGLIEHEFV